MPPPNLAPNKFVERLSGASRMQGNLLAAGATHRTPLRELTSLPKTPIADGEETGCPYPKLHPALGPLGLGPWPSPLTRNKGLGPSKHDELDAPMTVGHEPDVYFDIFLLVKNNK